MPPYVRFRTGASDVRSEEVRSAPGEAGQGKSEGETVVSPSLFTGIPRRVSLLAAPAGAGGGTATPPAGQLFALNSFSRSEKLSYSLLSEAIRSRTLWMRSVRHALAPQKA